MGISYGSVGVIGIELTEERIQKFVSSGYFTQEEWEEDYYECLETISEKLDHSYESSGNFYHEEDITHYLLVDGDNLKEVLENHQTFIDKLKTVGIELSIEDLDVISDYVVS